MQATRISASLLCVVSAAAAAPQQQPPSTTATALSPAATHGTAPDALPDRMRQVEVAFVGPIATDAMLVSLVEELLASREVTVIRRTQSVLVESDLLRLPGEFGGKSTRVWITLPNARLVRIWFADPNLERYLWRELSLENGLDPIAREQIAQVVQSSTEALNRGIPTLTQADARQAWQEQQKSDGQKSISPRENQVSIVTASVRVVPIQKPPRRWRSYLGAGYTVQWTGEMGLLHGPIAELGLDRVNTSDVLGLHVAAEPHFIQSYSGSVPAGLRLQSNLGWLLLCWRDAITSRLGFNAKFGVGAEMTRIEPRAVANSKFVPLNPSYNYTGLLRLRVGLDGALGGLLWETAGVVDISPSRTHYDIDQGGELQERISPWSVRPGIQAQVAWR